MFIRRLYIFSGVCLVIILTLFLIRKYSTLLQKTNTLTTEIKQVRGQRDVYLNELNSVKRELYLLKNDLADVEWPGTNTTFSPKLTGFHSDRIVIPGGTQVTTQKITYHDMSAVYFSTNLHPAPGSEEWINITMYQYEHEPYFTHAALQNESDNNAAKIFPIKTEQKDYLANSKQGLRIYRKTNEQFRSVSLQFFMTPSDGRARFVSLTKSISGQKELPEATRELKDIVDSLEVM